MFIYISIKLVSGILRWIFYAVLVNMVRLLPRRIHQCVSQSCNTNTIGWSYCCSRDTFLRTIHRSGYKIYSLYWSVIYASCLILQLVKANTISPITAILIGRKLEIIPAHSEVKLRF